jgi:hypothetical protein
MENYRAVKNNEHLTSLFGCWPSFHDSEVIWLRLDRGATSLGDGPTVETLIHTYEITNEVNAEGFPALRNHVLVHLRFSRVMESILESFNCQNALFGLSIKDIRNRQMEYLNFEIRFDSSFGLEASFQCQDIEVVDVSRRTPGRWLHPPECCGGRSVLGRAARIGPKSDSYLVCRGESAAGPSSSSARDHRIRGRPRLSGPNAGGFGPHEADLVPIERPGPPSRLARSWFDRCVVVRPVPGPARGAAATTDRDARPGSVTYDKTPDSTPFFISRRVRWGLGCSFAMLLRLVRSWGTSSPKQKKRDRSDFECLGRLAHYLPNQDRTYHDSSRVNQRQREPAAVNVPSRTEAIHLSPRVWQTRKPRSLNR